MRYKKSLICDWFIDCDVSKGTPTYTDTNVRILYDDYVRVYDICVNVNKVRNHNQVMQHCGMRLT
jgi:hypothetical protein